MRGTLLTTMTRPTGVIMAPPIPCTVRQSTISASVPDRPHSTELMVNTAMAARNTCRAPKRSAIQPLIGTNTASASR